jgi:hypothetical protein
MSGGVCTFPARHAISCGERRAVLFLACCEPPEGTINLRVGYAGYLQLSVLTPHGTRRALLAPRELYPIYYRIR